MRDLPGGGLRLTLEVARVGNRDVSAAGPRGLRLTVFGETGRERLRSFLPGDRLRAHATLRRPRSFGNPGAFDAARFLLREGIVLLGTVKSPLRIRRERPGRWTPDRLVARARAELVETLRRVGADGEGAGLVLAMVWGVRDSVQPRERRAMIDGGTYHLVAISGLHLGLLVWSLLTAARRLGAGRRGARACVLVLLPAYAALTGGSPPVVRAAWMAGALLCAGLCGRRPIAWNALALAALGSLVPHPAGIADAGLELSFAATGAILLLGRPLATRLPGPRWLRGGIAASLAAFLGIAPILATIGSRIAPVSILANLPSVPLAGCVVVAGVAASGLECVHTGLGGWAGSIALSAAGGILRMSELAASLPGGAWAVPPPPVHLALVYYVLLLALGLRTPRPLRASCGALLILALGALLAGGSGAPPGGTLRLDFLDVGQGDAILIRLPQGETILVDAGGFRASDFDVGERVVLPTLWRLGVRRIDLAVGAHAHHDHLGGLPAVIAALPTRELWLASGPGGTADTVALRDACLRRGTRLRRVAGALRRRFGAVRVEVVHPGRGFARDDANEASIVLRLSLGRRRVLLTGDAGRPAERAMLAGAGLGPCDVLKVGHHGSRTASTGAFLRQVRPRVAIISVGSENPWGHPAPAVVQRLAASGARVLRTDRRGMVTVETDGDRLWWSAARGPAWPEPPSAHPAPCP